MRAMALHPNDTAADRLSPESRHSRQVARLRIALPVAALVILAVVMLWPVAAAQKIIALPPVSALPQLTMEQPRFSGTDDQNRPFTVAAERAIQQPQQLLTIDLEKLQANMTMADGTPMTGIARRGRFDQGKKRLWLGGDVHVQQPSRNYRFSTSEMFVDFGQRAIWGNRPARLTGDFGSIEGQSFRVYDGGKVMLFSGASRAVLNGTGGMNSPGALLGK